MSKRIFDILMSLMGIIVLSPIFLLIAIWIKYDSKGPVLYRQVRIGLNGKPFKIHKFRTMKIGSDKVSRLTVGKDNRITRPGYFLRKSKIDELPQLIDVLRGEMSLVGPRPEVEEFIAHYSYEDKLKVLSVRPGITDEASIKMVDENEILSAYDDPKKAYIEVILPAKINYYKKYADNNSLAKDIKIIFRTLMKILNRI